MCIWDGYNDEKSTTTEGLKLSQICRRAIEYNVQITVKCTTKNENLTIGLV